MLSLKSIRNIALATILTVGAFSTVLYTSCNKDACKDVVCQNGGTCVNGTCSCATGYEGTNCETLSATKFVGLWTVAETCNGTASPSYQVTVTTDPAAPNKVLVKNLGNYGCTVGGEITWNGVVNAAQLTINDNKCSYQMNATGNYANGKVTFTYTATYSVAGVSKTDNCSATLSK
jgi:hypothetical protein